MIKRKKKQFLNEKKFKDKYETYYNLKEEKEPTKWLVLRHLKPYWFFAVLCSLCMIGEVVCDLFLPLHMAKIIDVGIKESQMNVIYIEGLYMVLIAIAGGFAGFMSAVFGSIASRKFGNDLRKDCFDKAIHFSWEQTDKFTTGSLITRITNDVIALQIMVSMSIRMVVRTVMLFIGGITFMVNINPKFGIVLLCVLPFEVLLLILFLRKVNPYYMRVQQSLDGVNEVMQENVNGSRVVKAFVNEDSESSRFDEASVQLSKDSISVQKLLAYLSPFQTFFLDLTVILIMFIGGKEVLNNASFQIGEVSAALTYITQILHSVIMMGNLFQNVARATASSSRLREILQTKPVITDGDNNYQKVSGNVEFKNVTFKYTEETEEVLKDISFKVNKGETLAILGATGCGKSTIVNLIPRFYDAKGGSVLIDDINVKDYTLKNLRQNIGVVLQKSELFTGSIFDNIRWGKPNATLEEVRNAARIAQADDFITSFQDGYDTIIGEKGSSLSGGQKQRICIARALLKKPQILIFDDATSALDLATEAKLYKTLKEEMDDLTIILVAQRVASAKGAEKIMVLEDGYVSGIGTNDELLKTNSVYQDIYYSQLKDNGGEGNAK